MTKTIFWSWQSDYGDRENRSLIRESLLSAIDILSVSSSLEERIEVDHDTKGLPGSPDIVASILLKIDRSSVFVGDVTPIAQSETGKHLANPNVLIELGYAKKALGPEQIITVWNTAHLDSRPEHLPFDLRGRRGPISYCLSAGASKAEYRAARTDVSAQLARRLADCLEAAPKPSAWEPTWQPNIDGDPSIWIPPNVDFRVNEGWGSGTKHFVDGGRWYVRVLPKEIDAEAIESGAHGPFMDGYGGFSWGRIKGGLLTYSGSVRADVPPDLDAGSMWFDDTGEIWMFQSSVAAEYRGIQQFFGDHIAHKWLEFTGRGLAKLRDHGGMSPFHVRVGVTGLEGTHWPSANPIFGEPPVALEDQLEYEFVSNTSDLDDWFDDVVEAWNRLRRIFSVGKIDQIESNRWKEALGGKDQEFS